MKNSVQDQVRQYKENIEPDPVVAERILHQFADSVTHNSEGRLLTKRRWFFALNNVTILFAMFQTLGMKIALAAVVAVATIGGAVAISSNSAGKKQSIAPNVAEVTQTPAAQATLDISTEADIQVLTNEVEISEVDLDKIENDLASLDVSLSTQDLDKEMAQLESIN